MRENFGADWVDLMKFVVNFSSTFLIHLFYDHDLITRELNLLKIAIP